MRQARLSPRTVRGTQVHHLRRTHSIARKARGQICSGLKKHGHPAEARFLTHKVNPISAYHHLTLIRPVPEPINSQNTNSNPSQPQFQALPERSSQPPVPLFDGRLSQRRSTAGLEDILNPQPKQNLVLPDENSLNKVIEEFAHQTSGLTIEQMEQVNSVVMDTLWQTRGEWDRSKVLNEMVGGFNAVIKDMQVAGQEFGPSSWGRSTQGSGDA
jgi:hypothetical protein